MQVYKVISGKITDRRQNKSQFGDTAFSVNYSSTFLLYLRDNLSNIVNNDLKNEFEVCSQF